MHCITSYNLLHHSARTSRELLIKSAIAVLLSSLATWLEVHVTCVGLPGTQLAGQCDALIWQQLACTAHRENRVSCVFESS